MSDPTSPGFGALVRYWRRVRAMSQLDLASAAMTTPRHMSFLETGRSNPSREMVLRLAGALDVPLRDRNGLLLSAGFAPLFPHRGLEDSALDRVTMAIGRMLDQHEPFPAVVLDRGWNLVRANDGAARLFGALFAPGPVPGDANVLRLILEPGPVRDGIANWTEVVPALLERARREAVGGVLDLATAELVQELRARPEVEALITAPRMIEPLIPVVDVHFRIGGEYLRFFSMVSSIGTPADVTAQELRVEAFFPSDDGTARRWQPRTRP
ncbi:helix-turn-helix transcriptional regulator [Actinomadura soli]|uniref:Helix-turn-helix transcriptional regulator n=1 Tax=Actinomadura soli TaxID=2508997 RepID=A0A5C4J630_9ACTN|nr:helix-turn-helix transcriptional regulator [Actinomadura soli]TMQ92896.1 helix-turn-helix transcriptional regulator [Actinomadura soli]